MDWDTPVRPTEMTENRLVTAILDGRFPIHSNLPPERELAEQIGVTRPTLREVLQRLAREGWVEIHHGRPTRVRDYWKEGSLSMLPALVSQGGESALTTVTYLLEVRLLLAPNYTRRAIERSPAEIYAFLEPYKNLTEDPRSFAEADWNLHARLSMASGNRVFALMNNGFKGLVPCMAETFFTLPATRSRSRTFYSLLTKAARAAEPEAAEAITRRVLQESLNLWTQQSEPGASDAS